MIPNGTKICPTCEGIGYLNVRTDGEKSTTSKSSEKMIQSRSNNTNERNGTGRLNAAGCVSGKSLKNHYESPDRLGLTADYVATLNNDFLGDADKVENMQETLKLSIQKLKRNNWESSVSALLNIVHISRIHPEMIDSSMPLITRSLHSLMKNVRAQVVRTACQIAEELFKSMQCTQRPEFDELVSTVLQKTSHMNKSVRHDANKALDAMVVYLPAPHCVSVMSSSYGAGHKSPIVRGTVSRLLYNIVSTIGVETFLTTNNLRDTRRKIFVMCIEFLTDQSTETRCNARRLMQLLMRHNEFDVVFGQDVERALFKKIEKQLVALKYEQSSHVN